MRQLNLEVSSFLSDPFHTFENRLLPNDVIVMMNLEEEVEAKMTNKDVQHKPEAWSNMTSSLPRPPGLVCHKLVTHDASGLRFDDPHMDGKIIS
jgi:hypothetical protein